LRLQPNLLLVALQLHILLDAALLPGVCEQQRGQFAQLQFLEGWGLLLRGVLKQLLG